MTWKNRDRLTSYFTVYLEVDVENYKTVIISKQKLIHPQQGIKMLRHLRTSTLNLFTVANVMLKLSCHSNYILNKYATKITTMNRITLNKKQRKQHYFLQEVSESETVSTAFIVL